MLIKRALPESAKDDDNVKKVLEYVYNYAQYIVTDGKNEVICMCLSVPLPGGKEPEIGAEITKIYAFSIEGVFLKKITKGKHMNDSITKLLFGSLGYKIRGRILDSKKAIIKVYDFTIDLENEYPNGFGEDLKNGDYVEFSVDRLDCVIKNHY